MEDRIWKVATVKHIIIIFDQYLSHLSSQKIKCIAAEQQHMHTIQFPPGPRLVMRFPLFVSNHNKSKLKLLFAIFSFLCPSLGGSGAQHKGSPWNGRPCTILLQSTRLIFIYNNHLSVDVSKGLANIMNQKVLMKILPIREGKQINGNKPSLN